MTVNGRKTRNGCQHKKKYVFYFLATFDFKFGKKKKKQPLIFENKTKERIRNQVPRGKPYLWQYLTPKNESAL